MKRSNKQTHPQFTSILVCAGAQCSASLDLCAETVSLPDTRATIIVPVPFRAVASTWCATPSFKFPLLWAICLIHAKQSKHMFYWTMTLNRKIVSKILATDKIG